jgi:hypothetical protein
LVVTGALVLKGDLLLMQGRTDGGVALLQIVLEPLRTEQLDIVLAPALPTIGLAPKRAIAGRSRAQSDGAPGWELRAANSLVSLLIGTNRPKEARSLLERTRSAFSEGFEASDFAQAGALLEASRRALHR